MIEALEVLVEENPKKYRKKQVRSRTMKSKTFIRRTTNRRRSMQAQAQAHAQLRPKHEPTGKR